MKILIVSFLYEVEIGGGAAVVVNQLANLLLSANHEVVILTSWEGRQVKTEKINGIKIIRIPAFNLYWVFHKDTQPTYKKVAWQLIDTWNPWVYRVCREIFIREAPDVVHVHKLRGFSPSVWSAASAAGIRKIVHTCHDYEVLSPEGLLTGKVGKLAREQSILLRPYQIIRRSVSKVVDVVTFPSVYAREVHLKMGFFSAAIKRVIPNSHGFSQKCIEARQSASLYNEKTEIKQFLFVGRLDKAKGIEILCDAFIKLKIARPDVILQIAGWGPLEGSLKAKYGHYSYINFIGPVFGERKEEIFTRNDVLVAPSLVPETFGIVIVEGFAYGLPAIATRVGAFPEVVKEGYTGYLADPNSIDKLYDAMVKISSAPLTAIEMSGNCFTEAVKYSTESFIENYSSIY
jgi:glycosyltransferase involved in cell wall biosynthesis